MNFKSFCELKSNDPMENIFPKPTSPKEGIDILIKYLLGEDWFTVMPMSYDQITSEAIADIMIQIPSAKYRKYSWWKKLYITVKCFITSTPKYYYY